MAEVQHQTSETQVQHQEPLQSKERASHQHPDQPAQDGQSATHEKTNLAESLAEQTEKRSTHNSQVQPESASTQNTTTHFTQSVHQNPTEVRHELFNLHDKVDKILGKYRAPHTVSHSSVGLYNSHLTHSVAHLIQNSPVITTYHASTRPSYTPLHILDSHKSNRASHITETLRNSISKVDEVLRKSRNASPASPRRSVKFAEEYTSVRHVPHIVSYVSENPFSKPEVLITSTVSPYVTTTTTTHYTISTATTPFKPRYDESKLDKILSGILTVNKNTHHEPIHFRNSSVAHQKTSHVVTTPADNQRISYRVSTVEQNKKAAAPVKAEKFFKNYAEQACGDCENDEDSMVHEVMQNNANTVKSNPEAYNNYYSGAIEHDNEEKPRHKPTKRQQLINDRRSRKTVGPNHEEKPVSQEQPQSATKRTIVESAEFVKKGPYEQKAGSQQNVQKTQQKAQQYIAKDGDNIEDFDFSGR